MGRRAAARLTKFLKKMSLQFFFLPSSLAMSPSLLLLLFSAIFLPTALSKTYNTTSSRRRGVINLHLVPHTHDE